MVLKFEDVQAAWDQLNQAYASKAIAYFAHPAVMKWLAVLRLILLADDRRKAHKAKYPPKRRASDKGRRK